MNPLRTPQNQHPPQSPAFSSMEQRPSGSLAALPAHSNDPEEELPRVLYALQLVFQSSAPATGDGNRGHQLQSREMADRYLTSFQHHFVAWLVCDRILTKAFGSPAGAADRCNDERAVFFAAQTMHAKCRTDVYQLIRHNHGSSPEDTLNSLRDSLMHHATTLATTNSNRGTKPSSPTQTRLCMALSSLAVQMGWTTVIPDIIRSIYTPNPDVMCGVVFDIFQLLPEECASDRLLVIDGPSDGRGGEQRRMEFRRALRETGGEMILGFLHHVLQQQSNATVLSTSVKKKVLHCLHTWIRYVDIEPRLLEASPLLGWTFSVLVSSGRRGEREDSSTEEVSDDEHDSEELFEIAVDVIIELLRMYPSDEQENMGLVRKIIPLVMSLGGGNISLDSNAINDAKSPFQAAMGDEDEDAIRGYCRIFTEMGESYMSLIVSSENLNQETLVDLVLLCSAIPDNEISNITLHFWYRFVSWLESLEPYEYRQLQIDQYTPQLTRLINICTKLMRYPPDILSLSDDRIDEIYKDRYLVADTMEDCCRLLGGEVVLRNVGNTLQEECQSVSSSQSPENRLMEWHGIESCLFALASIARYIADNEPAVLPFVMSLIPQLPPFVPLLHTTANLVVGKYALWLDAHPDVLQPLLPYLAQGLSEKKCASAAAVAIKELCESCGKHFSLGDPVLHLYDGIVAAQQLQSAGVTTPVLNLRDELEVLEGACKAVSRQLEGADTTSADSVSGYINRIVMPIGARLTAVAAPGNSAGPKQAAAEVDRLTVVVRFLNVPRMHDTAAAGNGSKTTDGGRVTARSIFLVDLMTRSWPLLDTISQKYTRDAYLAEKLCRLHKHVLRECGAAAYRPLLEPLRAHLVRNFAQSHLSPYLYAASICITEYGRDSSYTLLLFEMVSAMASSTFSFLTSMNEFTEHPDVVEEFFFLAGRMMLYCPDPLVRSPLLRSFLQCAAVAMRLEHKDANRGTLNFIGNMVDYGLSLGNNNDISHGQQASKHALENAIVSEGQPIVSNLAQSLLGNLPLYRIDGSSGSIAGILYTLNQLCPALLMQWMIPALSAAPDPAKAVFLGAFSNQSLTREEFFESVIKFSSNCNRNRRIRR